MINRIVNFRDCWSSCNLLDVGTSGCRFTWVRKAGERLIWQEKLDRVLWNSQALLMNPNAKAIVLPHLCFDHHPILLDTDYVQFGSMGNRPSRFEAAWLSHSEFKSMFSLAWGKGNGRLTKAIKEVTKGVQVRKRDMFGSIQRNKRILWARI